jgi:predicted transcriptional regulator
MLRGGLVASPLVVCAALVLVALVDGADTFVDPDRMYAPVGTPSGLERV